MKFDLYLYWPLTLLLAPVLGAVFYYYRFWWPVLRYKDAQSGFNQNQQPVSVIIAARNEADNLSKHLPLWLDQDYPDYELIVINDCSYDESADILREMQAAHPRLKVVTVEEQPKYPTGKKFALTLGIKAAAHNVLLFTDADCVPASRQWIQRMQQQYIGRTEIVLGHCAYQRRPGLLNAMIRLDTTLTALHYLGHALNGRAFMGKGGNLSYLRSLFFFQKGFVSHIKHHSGDDALFVNQAANANNVRICIHPEAFTYSIPKTTWSSWFTQKARHISNSKFFKASDKYWLGFAGLMHWWSGLSLAIALWWYQADNLGMLLAAGIFMLAYLHRFIFVAWLSNKFKEVKFVPWLLLVLPLYLPVQMLWSLKGYFGKSRW